MEIQNDYFNLIGTKKQRQNDYTTPINTWNSRKRAEYIEWIHALEHEDLFINGNGLPEGTVEVRLLMDFETFDPNISLFKLF